MYQIGKTIYLTTEGIYIKCEEETITFELPNGQKQRLPYVSVSEIIIFYNTTLSSYLMYQCSKHNIIISYISVYGKYRGCFQGELSGNVLLRKKQFDMIETKKSEEYVRNLLAAKIKNSIWTLTYFSYHNDNKESIQEICQNLKAGIKSIKEAKNIDEMRIIEANLASKYFSCFDLLLKTNDVNMKFEKRTKRPPQNNVNVLLSLFYTLTTSICEAALMARGLDSECGYLHVLRSGRHSLACDLVEEFRSCVVDRFVISIINRKEIKSEDFISDNNGIKLSPDAQKLLFQKWEKYLCETEVLHHLYNKKMSLKYVFYEQAQLIAQYIREDISEYPPFLMIS